MPFFVPQEPPRPLPLVGTAIERAIMDWKVVSDGTDFHKAKDVAAFANHLGGTLLIGAKETEGHLECYVGMEPADAGELRERLSKIISQRCEPLPLFDFEKYPAPNDPAKEVVAVNVWPSLLLIGVRLKEHKPSEGYGGDSFVYPVRAGIDAHFLTPGQIAMYMTPQIRRVAVLLSQIPPGGALKVLTNRGSRYDASFKEVREDQNIVILRDPPILPLDCIKTVYQQIDAEGKTWWQVIVDYGTA